MCILWMELIDHSEHHRCHEVASSDSTECASVEWKEVKSEENCTDKPRWDLKRQREQNKRGLRIAKNYRENEPTQDRIVSKVRFADFVCALIQKGEWSPQQYREQHSLGHVKVAHREVKVLAQQVDYARVNQTAEEWHVSKVGGEHVPKVASAEPISAKCEVVHEPICVVGRPNQVEAIHKSIHANDHLTDVTSRYLV